MDNSKRPATLDFVLMLIFLLPFLVLLVLSILFGRFFPYLCLALLLVPSGSFCFFWRYDSKHDLSKTKRIVIRTISIILSVVLLLFSSGKMILEETLAPAKDPIFYQRLLHQYGYPGNSQMAHFPKVIPSKAKAVRFYEEPAFLQGGSDFILKYRTDIDEINQIYAKYSAKAQAVTKFQSDDSSVGMPDFSMDEVGYMDLPSNFDLIILDSQPYKPYDWNHGYTYGIAVSKQRLEVIYWSQYW